MNRISNSNPNILYILSIHVRSAHLVHYGHGFYAYRADALQQVDYPLLVAGEAVGVAEGGLNLAAMVGSTAGPALLVAAGPAPIRPGSPQRQGDDGFARGCPGGSATTPTRAAAAGASRVWSSRRMTPASWSAGRGALPIRSVQWYLDTVHQLRLSVGAIVSAIHQTAQRAQPAVARILDRIRASPVVHADETGWRRGRRQRLRVDFQHPHRTLLPAAGSGQGGGGRSAGRVVLRSAGQRFLRRLPPL